MRWRRRPIEAISAGITADHAWRSALDAEIAGYRAAEDEYFRARAADLVDIRDRVLAHLSGVDTVARIAGGSVVAADDITPSAFLAADWTRGGAIALAAGSPPRMSRCWRGRAGCPWWSGSARCRGTGSHRRWRWSMATPAS